MTLTAIVRVCFTAPTTGRERAGVKTQGGKCTQTVSPLHNKERLSLPCNSKMGQQSQFAGVQRKHQAAALCFWKMCFH